MDQGREGTHTNAEKRKGKRPQQHDELAKDTLRKTLRKH